MLELKSRLTARRNKSQLLFRFSCALFVLNNSAVLLNQSNVGMKMTGQYCIGINN